MATEIMTDAENGTIVLNDTDISDSEVMSAFSSQNPELAALVRWSSGTQGGRSGGGLFERDRYITPENVFDQMRTAQLAAQNDDVVSGVLESTESLAFSKMSIDAEDEDETDIWNQIAADLDLDSRLREMWRELFTVSQFYLAIWWGTKDYRVRGRTDKGVARKKAFADLQVPLGLSLLDPTKVIPIGSTLFNRERLAYIANPTEAVQIDKAIGRRAGDDPMIETLIVSKYETRDPAERTYLSNLLAESGSSGGVDRLYILNPENVFRHTDTRSQYQRFATVRMKSVFELLDMKHQLRQMDRAHLLGATNFIVLVTKGSDTLPARPEEISNLQTQVKTVARVPILVGDHRLDVKIVTPKTDNTLEPARYNGIDARISARLYQIFMTGNFAAGAKGDDSIKLARVVARGLESRRHMLRRALEKNVLQAIFEKNSSFSEAAKLRFHPKHVALDFDANLASYLLDLRSMGDLSRETMLEEIDFGQDEEAKRRKRERDKGLDDIFKTAVPFSGGGGNPLAPGQSDPDQPMTPAGQKNAGRRGGGNKGGGGAAPGSGQGEAPRNPRKKSD